MKSYVVTTGIIFGLIALAHVARVFAEGSRLIREPFFLLTSLIALSLCAWAAVLSMRLSRGNS
jgi:hypothetical protein